MSRITVRIGPCRVGVEVEPRAWLEPWLPWFRRYRVEGPPAVLVRLEVDPAVDAARAAADLAAFQGLGEPGEEPAGLIGYRKGEVSARVPPALLAREGQPGIPRVENILLCGAFNAWVEERGLGDDLALFHGCGLARGDRAVLLAGPSGAGKSTLAALAGPGAVLHDEALVVVSGGGRIIVEGTPLVGSSPGEARGPLPLGLLAFLVHGQENRFEPLPADRAVAPLVPQVFRTCPPFPGETARAGEPARRLAWAVRLAEAVPAGVLRFRPEPGALAALPPAGRPGGGSGPPGPPGTP